MFKTTYVDDIKEMRRELVKKNRIFTS